MLELSQGEDIDSVGHKLIDQLIALQHIRHDFVVERIAPVEQALVDLWKDLLQVAEGSVYRDEIEYAHGPTPACRRGKRQLQARVLTMNGCVSGTLRSAARTTRATLAQSRDEEEICL
jgi:hypothetical protein